jgi:hypothetical protein
MTAQLPHGTDHEIGPEGDPPAGQRQRTFTEPDHGLYAVLACLLVLGTLDGAALVMFSGNMGNAVAVIGAISSPIVAMVSAYFGIKVGVRTGTAVAAAASEARRKAENEAKSMLGHMSPDQAKPLMRRLGIPVAD